MTTIGTDVHPKVDPEKPESFPSARDYLEADTGTVPPLLFERSLPSEAPSGLVSKESYVSEEWFRLEFERLWSQVWQMACWGGDIPECGDYIEYQIGSESVIVVRQADASVRAFHNVCRHRGARLVEGSGQGSGFACPFHNWNWNLDGSLRSIPCRWDFPQVEDEDYGLPEVRTAVWNGFVYINFSATAPSFEDYLGDVVPRHFEQWPNDHRMKAVHVAREIKANWKIALEAFLELYHVAWSHPQTTTWIPGINSQYDQYGLHGRLIGILGAPSPFLGMEMSDQDVVDSMLGDHLIDYEKHPGAEVPQVQDGESARAVIATWMRDYLRSRTGCDYTDASDTEILDVIQYFVFPNNLVWGSRAAPIYHRCRPGRTPDSCIFEIIILADYPASMEKAPFNAEMKMLGVGESWTAVSELGGGGHAFDQDTDNIERIQRGLMSSSIDSVTFSRYQEGNIRNYHANLERYLATPPVQSQGE